MTRIEHGVQNGGSLKAGNRRLGMAKDQMYAGKHPQCNVVRNRDKIVIVSEEFYRDLYSSSDIQKLGSSSEEVDIPPATTDVKNALKETQGSKPPGGDQMAADLLKDASKL